MTEKLFTGTLNKNQNKNNKKFKSIDETCQLYYLCLKIFVISLNVGSIEHFSVDKEHVFVIISSSRKHLHTKVTTDFHLTYSKNGGNLGSESK